MFFLHLLELSMLMQVVIFTRKVSGQVLAYISPDYVEIGEIATFTGIAHRQGESDSVFWIDPYYVDVCPRDCVDDSDGLYTCTSGAVQLQQCWCEGNSSEGYCDAGTTNVTFQIQVNFNHIGFWTCQYSNFAAVVDLKQFIQSTPPSISGDLEVAEHTPTTLTCTSTAGNPPAQFQWSWSDGSMDHNVTADAEDGGPGVSTILITPDRGYKAIKCVVMQLEGKDPQQTVEDLNILHGASVVIQPCPVTHVALRGSDVEFTCDITMTGNPKEGSYEWKRDSVVIAGEAGEVYRIPSVDVTHEAKYSCLFDNGQTEGGTESTTQLTVHYHPEDVQIAEGDTVVTENDTLTLTCSASALPQDITYTWTVPGIDVDRVENPLVLDNILVSNAGEYVCEAENTVTVCGGDTVIGGKSTTVNVRVYRRSYTGLVVGLTLLLLFLVIAAVVLVLVILVMKGVIKFHCKQSDAETDGITNHSINNRSKVIYENTGCVSDDYKVNENDNQFSDISSEYLTLGDSSGNYEVPINQITAINNFIGKHPDGSHDDYEEIEASGDVSLPQGVTYKSLSSTTFQNIPVMNESEKHYQSLQKGTAV